MESVSKLEAMVAKWYEGVPHLPVNGRKWLSENVWWLVLVGTILTVLGIFGLFSLLFFSGAVLIGAGGAVGATIGGILWIAALVSVVFLLIQLVIMAMAISPLKNMQKRGWTLLFVVMLLNIVADAVGFLFKLNVFDLVWSLLMAAVSAYFLFEIRGSFVTVSAAKRATPGKVIAKKA